MFRRAATAASGAVLLVGSALSLVPAESSVPDPRAPAPVLKIAKFRHDFSPNKDGYHDQLKIPVVLSRGAVLTVRVVGLDSKLVLVRPGKAICLAGDCRLARGTHTVRWSDILPLMAPYRPGPGQRFRLTFHASTPGGKRTGVARTVVTLRNPVQVDDAADDKVFSPNGDGRHDRLRIGYTLEQSARARVVVRAVSGPNGQVRVVDQVRLGRLKAGHHTWTWSPKQKGAARPADGTYRVTVIAVPPAHRPGTGRDSAVVAVDTVGPDATSTSTRTTVYPATTLFTDEARFEFGPDVHSLSASVRRPDGSLVRTLQPGTMHCYDPNGYPEDVVSCALLRWDGRSVGGAALPAGSYVLRAVGFDAVGNRAAATTPLTVSDQPLVEHTSTTTLPAAKWVGGFDWCGYPGAPAGCSLNYNRPVASDRFTDGLSFRAGSRTSEVDYAVEGDTGHEKFRVTATGGPTTIGDPDTAWLTSTTMQGEGTFTTDWIPVTFTSEQLKARGTWGVRTSSGNDYDVASYTVEQTYFAPAS
jgi:hypothetical protein